MRLEQPFVLLFALRPLLKLRSPRRRVAGESSDVRATERLTNCVDSSGADGALIKQFRDAVGCEELFGRQCHRISINEREEATTTASDARN